MLRTGVKRLFVTERGQWREITPVCVLDFYVHESCQVRPPYVPAVIHPTCQPSSTPRRRFTPHRVSTLRRQRPPQRQGVGLKLFEHFLAAERQSPARLAYDRPSPKLLGFVSKHYGLKSFTPQVCGTAATA
jgi:alpha-tubulin N-acetyltransferase 1